MFEGLLADALNAALGAYCVGIDPERVRVSVFSGDIELHDVLLRPSALESLGLPAVVDAGRVSAIRVRVPWRNLGREPVTVELDGVFALACRTRDEAGAAREARTRREAATRSGLGERLRVAEDDWLRVSVGAGTRSSREAAKRSDSWYWRTLSTVLGNLQIKVTNVHVRYEDDLTTPGNAFACGMTIGSVSMITVDDEGKPTFTTGGALERISKRAALENFSWYLDAGSHVKRWKTHDGWKPPDVKDSKAWWEMFGVGLNGEASSDVRRYMLHPATVELFYHRKGKKEHTEPNEPRQMCVLNFGHARVGMSRLQYHSMVRLAEVVELYRLRLPHAHWRPDATVKAQPRAWWTYAKIAVVARKKNVSGTFEWRAIKEAGRKRREYLAMYITEGGASNPDFLRAIEEIEQQLDFEVALAWRCIAHSQTKNVDAADRVTSIAASARRRVIEALRAEESEKGGYFSWMWRSSSKSIETTSKSLEMSADDWNKLEELVRGGEEEDFDPRELGMEFRGTLERLTMELRERNEHDDSERVVIKSSMAGTCITSKSYRNQSNTTLTINSWTCDTAEERILTSSTGTPLCEYALEVKHNSFPLEHDLDAEVDVRVAPAYIVFQGDMVGELNRFFNARECAKSDLSSLEEEAMMKLDAAKESTTAALKKIAMTLDIHAPKVRIPVARGGKVMFQTLVDFGHFNLSADPRDPSVTFNRTTGAPTYHTFAVTSTDTAVFFAPPDFDWINATPVQLCEQCEALISPCDAAMNFAASAAGWTSADGPRFKAQISMNAFQAYISPAKLARLYATIDVATKPSSMVTSNAVGTEVSSEDPKPWHDALLSGTATAMKVGMIGGGHGYHKRYLCIQGPYLYILEKSDSPSYVDYVRIGSNCRVSVLNADEIPSSGNPSVDEQMSPLLAIHDAKTPRSRAAEVDNTWLFRFKDQQEFERWRNWIQDLNDMALATRATQITSIAIAGEENNIDEVSTIAQEDVVDALLSMEISTVSVHLAGQPMGVHGALCDGLENGGVARALLRDLKDSTEVPIATFTSSSAAVTVTSKRCSREFDMLVSSMDVIDELCSGSDKACLLSAHESDGAKVRLNYKELNSNAPDYRNVDSTLRLDTNSVVFMLSRPTVGSLFRMQEEIRVILAAFSSPQAKVKKSASMEAFTSENPDRIRFQTTLQFRSVVMTAYLERKTIDEAFKPLFDCTMDDMRMEMRALADVTEISMSLGNLRVGDQFMASDNFYRNIIDLTSSDSSNRSRTQVDVSMYNHLSSKFPGFEYDVRVKFHDVRIIIMYSFIQRMLGYFSLFLPPPLPVSALPEAERNAELLRRGEPRPFTMMYSVEMERPELIFPRSSTSNQAFSIDAECVRVTNKLEWIRGSSHLDRGAVLRDTTKVSLISCESFIWNKFKRAASLMQERGTSIEVLLRRPLWDADIRTPSYEIIVDFPKDTEVEMTDAEYRLFQAVSNENFAETVEIPASLYAATAITSTGSSDSERQIPPQMILSVNVCSMRLTTFDASESSRRKPLAAFSLENVHVHYRKEKDGRMYVSIICPSLALLDLRLGTPERAQRALGSCCGSEEKNTLLRVDVTKTSTSYDCIAVLQSCRMMYDPQFGLAIYNFFTSTEDKSESGLVNARLKQDLNFGAKSRMTLHEDVELSASRRVLCNSPDGHTDAELCMQGHELVLHASTAPLIYIESGRTLKLMNARVVVPMGTELCDFVHMGSDSRLITDEADGVLIVHENRELMQSDDLQLVAQSKASIDFNVQASMPGLEVVFLDVSHGMTDYMLRVRTDAEIQCSSEGKTQDASFSLTSFQASVSEWGDALKIIDSSVVLRPINVDGHFRRSEGRDTEMALSSTECNFVFDAQSIERLLKLSKGFAATLQSTGLYNQVLPCSQFIRVGAQQGRACFWRAVPPTGFAIVGDCVTLNGKPPSHPVNVITDAEGLTKLPTCFERACTFDACDGRVPTWVWLPVAPDGYVSFGCVVTENDEPPPLDIVRCVRSEVVCGTNFGACLSQEASTTFLRQVNNNSHTFHVFAEGAPLMQPLDLRSPLLAEPFPLVAPRSSVLDHESVGGFQEGYELRTTTTYDCSRVWLDVDRHGRCSTSIWRPNPAQGYVSLGDCLVVGPDPPQMGVLVVELDGEEVAQPTGFMLVGVIPAREGATSAIWHPIAPPGYVSCGVVVTSDARNPPELTKCACIRSDLARAVVRNGTCTDPGQAAFDAIFVEDALWSSKATNSSLWSSDPDAPLAHLPIWGLFQFSSTLSPPPREYRPRLSVLDYVKARARKKNEDDMNISLKLSMPLMSVVLLEKETYSDPLVCASLSDTALVVSGTSSHMDGSTMFNFAVSSYNNSRKAWEPVVDSTSSHLRFSYSAHGDETAPSGTSVSVKTVTPLSVTISHRFVASALAWAKWRSDFSSTFSKSTAPRTADEDSVLYENQLVGQDVYLKLSDSSQIVCLKSGESNEVKTRNRHSSSYSLPLDQNLAASAYTGEKAPVRATWFMSVKCISADLSDADETSQITARIEFRFPEDLGSTELRTRALTWNSAQQSVVWNEAFHISPRVTRSSSRDFREFSENVLVGLTILDEHAVEFAGCKLAARSMTLRSLLDAVMISSDGSQAGEGNVKIPRIQGDGAIELRVRINILRSDSKDERGRQAGETLEGKSGVFVAFDPQGPWKSIDTHTATKSQIISDKSSRCIVKFAGPTVCTFQPVVTFKNDTIHDLEVCICPAGIHPDDAPGRSATKKSRRIYEEVFENQRRIPLVGWSTKHLLPTERNGWSNGQGGDSTTSIDEYTRKLLPPGFRWDGQWQVHVAENTDSEGWAYALNLPDLKYPFKDGRQNPLSMVRMRRWIRGRVPIEEKVAPLVSVDDASLRQRTIVKPNDSAGLIPSIVGPDAASELFVRQLTLQGPSSWGSETDEHGVWSCMIANAMEGSEVALVQDSAGTKRFIGMRVEAEDVGAKVLQDVSGPGDSEDGYYNLRPEGMEWRITAVSPHVIVNNSSRTMTLTLFQGSVDKPLSVKAVSTAKITPRSSLPLHSVHPETPYYVRVALDDGFEQMVPAKFLLPISPMSVRALRSAETFDVFDAFDAGFMGSSSEEDVGSSMDQVKLRSADGRTAFLKVQTEFGLLARSARKTVFTAPLMILNESGVHLAMRTSTADAVQNENDETALSKLTVLRTSIATSTQGVQLLRDFAFHKASSKDERIMLELGIANSIPGSKPHLSPAFAIDERELLQSSVIVRATCSDGSLYSLAVRMQTDHEYSEFGSQVVVIEPRCRLTNQTGMTVLMSQPPDGTSVATLQPTDTDIPLRMQTSASDGLVQFKLPNSSWSAPIDLYAMQTMKGSMKIPIHTSDHPDDFELLSIHVDLAFGVSKVSLSIENRVQSNILVENTSDVDVIAFRQAGASDEEKWRIVLPQSAKPFAWSRPQDARQLAIRVLQNGSLQGTHQRLYDFDNVDALVEDEILPGLPVPKIALQTTTPLDIDGGDSVYFNFLPVTRRLRRGMRIIRIKSYGSAFVSRHLRVAKKGNRRSSESRLALSISDSSFALVDATQNELVNLTARGVNTEYLSGVDAGIERVSIELKSLQVDDMTLASQYPVVMRLLGDARGVCFFSAKMVRKTIAGLGSLRAYPYVDVNFAPLDLQIAVHEPLIWRLVKFAGVFENNTQKDNSTVVQVAGVLPMMIGSFHVSAMYLRLRFRSALYARPRHAMPAFLAGISFVNIDDGQLFLLPVRVENARITESAFRSMIIDSYTRQAARQALLLLAGVDVLDSVSQALGQASAGIASLSLDGKFSRAIKAELGPDSVKADSIQAGLTTGTEMLARGVFRGLTGVIRKPLEGAQKEGALGFVKGVGKGLVGAVTQPIAGGLAAAGRAAEGLAVGVDGMKTSLGVNSSAPQLRVREARAQHADGVLRSFDEKSSRAQHALRTAQRGKLGAGQMDVFTFKSYYSADKYLASMEVNSRTAMIVLTDRRVVALRRISLKEDKYLSKWHVAWSELLHVETQGLAQVVLHLKEYNRKKRVFEKHRITRVIETTPGTDQATALMEMIMNGIKSHSRLETEADDDDSSEYVDLPSFLPCASWRCVVRKGAIAFWAPIPPSKHFVAFGHVIGGPQAPTEPVSVVLRGSGGSAMVVPPVRFDLVYRDESNFTVWWPIAPPGFRPLGAVVVAGVEAPRKDEVACVRTDFLTLSQFDDTPAWIPDMDNNETMRQSDRKHFENASMWSVDNLGRTFVCTRSRECPSEKFALDVMDLDGEDAEDDA